MIEHYSPIRDAAILTSSEVGQLSFIMRQEAECPVFGPPASFTIEKYANDYRGLQVWAGFKLRSIHLWHQVCSGFRLSSKPLEVSGV